LHAEQMNMRIGELLVKYGIINDTQLQEALTLQKNQGKKLGEILSELGYLTSEQLIWVLSEQVDIPYVDVQSEMLDEELLNSYPREILVANNILPLYATSDMVYIAIGDPTNSIAIESIRKHETRKIMISGADPKNIQFLLNKFFTEKGLADISEKGSITLTISSTDATVKLVDQTGKVHINRGQITLNLRMKNTKGEKNNA
jgi:hypothetical protein